MNFETAVFDICGEREHMEDTHVLVRGLIKAGDLFGGIYDGHDGDMVAKYIAENLHLRFSSMVVGGLSIVDAFLMSYQEMSNEVYGISLNSGACVANFFICDGKIYFANAGDVRILIVGRGVKQLTIDHRLTNTSELKRVEACGATIKKKRIIGRYGNIAITRAIGDFDFSEHGVIATPYVGQHNISPDDLMIIVCSDGLFEQMSNEQIAHNAISCENLELICKNLVRKSLDEGSGDNITAMLIKLTH